MSGRLLERYAVVWLVVCLGGSAEVVWSAEEAGDEAAAELPLELVQNGGFEETDREGSPVAWRAEWGGYSGVTIDLVKGGRARSGTRALRLESPTAPVHLLCFNRPLDVRGVAGRDVVVSCFYRTKAQPFADLSFVTYGQPFAEKGRATPYLTAESYPLADSPDWGLVSWRIRCPVGAREAIVSLRSSGAGEVVFDDVSVRPTESPVGMEPLGLGELVGLPAKREVRLRVHNGSPEELTAKVSLVVTAGKGRTTRIATVTAPAGGEETVAVTYNCPADDEQRVELALEDDDRPSVYDTVVASVPPLLSGQVVRPAFRGTILSSLEIDEFVVEGMIHASPDICSQLTLDADLGGAGCVARDGDGITRPDGPDTWRLVLPRKDMLTGRYRLTVTARREKQVMGSLALEVARGPERDNETGYDADGRLYVDGQPVFVNGIYNVNSIEALERVASQGFNTAVVSAGEAGMNLVDRARELGVMLVIHSPDQPLAGDGPGLSFWEHVVGKYGRLPGVVGWHLLGKPDASLMPFSVFAHQQTEMAKIDAHHPTITLLSVISLLPYYVPDCDIVAVEPQPVPALPVSAVADELSRAREIIGPHRPLWAAVQSVGRAWLVTGGGVEEEATGRPPTGPEHRAMTLLALAYGAQGLLHHGFYFAGTADRSTYYLPADAPDIWQEMKETNALVASLEGPLSRGTYRGVTVTDPVHIGAWDLDGCVYVLAVNAEPRPALTTFEVPGRAPERLYPLGRRSPAAKTQSGRFADQIPAYGARIYVSVPQGEADAGESSAG